MKISEHDYKMYIKIKIMMGEFGYMSMVCPLYMVNCRLGWNQHCIIFNLFLYEKSNNCNNKVARKTELHFV